MTVNDEWEMMIILSQCASICLKGLKETMRNTVKTSSLQTKNQTWNLLDMKQECCYMSHLVM